MNLVDRYLSECLYSRNYNWMIENLYIRPGQRFSPTLAQQEILLTSDNKKAFLLPRDSGATTIICMDAIAEAMINHQKEIIVFCPNQMSARNMGNLIGRIIDFSNIDITRMTQDRIIFQNGSVIRIMTCNPTFYRGLRPNAIYIDCFDMFNSEDLSNIFNRMMLETEKMLILGNSINDYESTQRVININPRNL